MLIHNMVVSCILLSFLVVYTKIVRSCIITSYCYNYSTGRPYLQHNYTIQTKEQLAKLDKSANIYHAPLAIVVCSDTEKAWTRPYDGKQTPDIDASIITDHMMLEATDLDLGSVWIGIFKPDVIKEEFHLPAHLEPISILAIGYVESSPANLHDHLATRLSLDELVLKIF